MKKFLSTKTYTHATGHSCAFRQWRSTHSHCRWIHGYSLQFKLTFGSTELDEKNWVVDFGGLKELKQWLADTFDHTLVIAEDDPAKDLIMQLQGVDAADIRILPNVGCERFAELIFDKASSIIEAQYGDRCWVEEVEVREHESNSAICRRA